MTDRCKFIVSGALFRTLFYLWVIIATCSCVTPWKINYLQDRPGVSKYSEMDSAELYAEYRLRPCDKLFISVTSTNKDATDPYSGGIGVTQMNMNQMGTGAVGDIYTYTIYGDSCIDFPYLGAVKVAGLTTREVRDLMKEKLKDAVPNVDVMVRLAGAHYAMIGHANGLFPITEKKLNIFQALSLAGDLPSLASRKHVRILRQIDGKTTVREFDVRSKDIINSEFYYIQPNDIIYVPSFSGQFFAVQSFTEVLAAITSTITFGVLVYKYSTKGF